MTVAGSNRKALEAIAVQMSARREAARRQREERGREGGKPKSERKGGKAQPDIKGPTPEQASRAIYALDDIVDKRPGGTNVTIGSAYRKQPMIDTLAAQGVFSDAEHKALKHYRHHADIADRSLLRDSLNRTRSGGAGDGPTRTLLNAIEVTSLCEAAAGSLAPILRAVVVYDWSLSEWAMHRHGSLDDCQVKNGKRVCRPKPKARALAEARQDIIMAAKRVMAELDA